MGPASWLYNNYVVLNRRKDIVEFFFECSRSMDVSFGPSHLVCGDDGPPMCPSIQSIRSLKNVRDPRHFVAASLVRPEDIGMQIGSVWECCHICRSCSRNGIMR